jgi:catechol 2,3-dioxygenase-like lactoylglutathione lyase family enzyme
METVIAGLLKDFEDGKMSRRQLIQSLALAAAAAMPGAALAQPPSPSASASQGQRAPAAPIPQAFEPAPWKTVWLDHISYAVSDYRKSTAFYRDLMGWTVRNDNGTSQATLDINGIGGIIIRNRRAPAEGQSAAGAANAQPAAAASTSQPASGGQRGQGSRPPITGVINHVSWGVQPWDTDKVKAELEKRGLVPRPDMVGENFKSFHVTDPDGWDLQISNQTRDSKD